MNSPAKLLFPIGIIAVVGIALVFYGTSSKTNEAATVTPSMTPTPQAPVSTVYADAAIGLSFTYPDTFDVEPATSADGKKHLIIDPFKSDPDTRTQFQSARLLSMRLLEGKTIEHQLAEYTKKENGLENVAMEDVTINGMHGKKVTYTTPIGLNPINVILPWNSSVLLISLEAGTEHVHAFETIINSVQKTN